MGITAERLHKLKLVDDVVPEPLGGAHRDPKATADSVRDALVRTLAQLQSVPLEALVAQRRRRIAGYGVFREA